MIHGRKNKSKGKENDRRYVGMCRIKGKKYCRRDRWKRKGIEEKENESAREFVMELKEIKNNVKETVDG